MLCCEPDRWVRNAILGSSTVPVVEHSVARRQRSNSRIPHNSTNNHQPFRVFFCRVLPGDVRCASGEPKPIRKAPRQTRRPSVERWGYARIVFASRPRTVDKRKAGTVALVLLTKKQKNRTSQVPLTYALSSGGLTDLVSCLPAFGSLQSWMASLAFVRSGTGDVG